MTLYIEEFPQIFGEGKVFKDISDFIQIICKRCFKTGKSYWAYARKYKNTLILTDKFGKYKGVRRKIESGVLLRGLNIYLEYYDDGSFERGEYTWIDLDTILQLALWDEILYPQISL